MRYSSQEGDAGHEAWLALMADEKKVVVTLDGIEQRKVLTADDETGQVVRIAEGRDGRPRVSGEEFVVETVTGCVVFKIESRS